MSARGKGRPGAEEALVAAFLLLLVGGIVYPLLQVLSVAVWSDGWPTLGPLVAFFGRRLFQEAFVDTLLSGALAVFFGSLLGVPLAFLTVR